jgi:hypothetical protein
LLNKEREIRAARRIRVSDYDLAGRAAHAGELARDTDAADPPHRNSDSAW